MERLETVVASANDAMLEAIDRDGGVIVSGVATPDECEAIRRELQPQLDRAEPGFEAVSGGSGTKRIGRLVKNSPTFRQVMQHPAFLSACARWLGGPDGFQFCSGQGIEVGPGANAQDMHTDEDLFDFPHPSPVMVVAMLAIDPFTAENGATLVIPGSHRWPRDRKPNASDHVVKAVMEPGSIVLMPGTTWHAGGSNQTAHTRLGLRMTYNTYWLRQQENQFLAVPHELVQTFSSELKGLLGFRVSYGMGAVQDDEVDKDDVMGRLFKAQPPPPWVLEMLEKKAKAAQG